MSTKKKLLLSTLVLAVLGGVWGYKKVKSMLRGGDIEDIAFFVPNDVSLFMANRGAGEQHFEFSRMGEIIEEAGPRTTFYLDQDEDGFGNLSDSIFSCISGVVSLFEILIDLPYYEFL